MRYSNKKADEAMHEGKPRQRSEPVILEVKLLENRYGCQKQFTQAKEANLISMKNYNIERLKLRWVK